MKSKKPKKTVLVNKITFISTTSGRIPTILDVGRKGYNNLIDLIAINQIRKLNQQITPAENSVGVNN